MDTMGKIENGEIIIYVIENEPKDYFENEYSIWDNSLLITFIIIDIIFTFYLIKNKGGLK